MDSYEILSKVGEGSFGEVFRAKSLESGTIVALKRIRLRRVEDGIPKTLLREIKALEHIDSSYVVKIHQFFPDGSSIIIVCEYMQSDLSHVMRSAALLCRPLRHAEIKSIMQMILKGIAAVHDAQIMHRDVKPANLLFSTAGVLKLGDFGLARVHQTTTLETQHLPADYSHEVATRWYRAPELLFGARRYGNEVDLWAVGCIFAELFTFSPLLPGENDIDQLYRVLRVLGTPDVHSWPELSELPDYNKIVFPTLPPVPLHEILPDVPADALALIQKFLVYRPQQRITAAQALLDPYFTTEPLPLHPSHLRQLAALPLVLRERRGHLSSAAAAISSAAAAGSLGNFHSSDVPRSNRHALCVSDSRRSQFGLSTPLSVADVGVMPFSPWDA